MHPLTAQALNSSLSYNGDTPQWFHELADQCRAEDKDLPMILDSFEHNGNTILVTWFPQSIRSLDRSPQKRGWCVSTIEYRELMTGEPVGYIKAMYATKETMARAGERNNAKVTAPTVDFSKLESEYRGQGLAPSLYVYLAKKLADQQMTLASSTVQTEYAVTLWNRILSQKMFPVTPEEATHGTKYIMDFRVSLASIVTTG